MSILEWINQNWFLLIIWLIVISSVVVLIIFDEKIKKSKKCPDFFKDIVAIILFPIYFSIRIVKSLIALIERVSSDLKQYITKKYEKEKKKKAVPKRVRELFTKVLRLNIPILNNTNVGFAPPMFIIILQTISFFTTWAGTKYYLSGVVNLGFLDGAFLLTLVIQGIITVFSINNYNHSTFRKHFILWSFVCISIVFSYVGMVNYAIKPYEKYSIEYDEKVYTSADILLKTQKKSFIENNQSPEQLANDINHDVTLILERLYPLVPPIISDENIMNLQEEKEKKLDNMDPDQEYQTGTDPRTGRVLYAYGNNPETLTMREQVEEKYDNCINTTIPDIKNVFDRIKTKLPDNSTIPSKYSIKNIVGLFGNSDDLDNFLKEYNSLVGDAKQLIEQLRTYYTFRGQSIFQEKINKYNDELNEWVSADLSHSVNEQYDLEDVVLLSSKDIRDGKTEIKSTENNPEHSNYSDSESPIEDSIINKSEEFFSKASIKKWIKRIIPTTTTEEYNNTVQAYYSVAQKYYQYFNNLVPSDNINLIEIETAMRDFNNKEDANMIAFRHFSSFGDFKRVLFPFILAIMIDGFTLLLARFIETHRNSPLYAKSNRDFNGDESRLFENVFISMNKEFINQTIHLDEERYITQYSNAVESTIKTVQDFLSKFEPSPETIHLGSSRKVKASTLNSDKNFAGLTSLLTSLGSLIHLTQEECKSIFKNAEEDYYFIKSSTEAYLQQSITSANIGNNFYSIIEGISSDETKVDVTAADDTVADDTAVTT